MICVNFQSQTLVERTKTIDQATLNSIREATAPGIYTDIMMRNYWLGYINFPTDTLFYNERGETRVSFGTGSYTYQAFWGAIGHDIPPDNEGHPIDPSVKLDYVKNILLEPTNPDGYLSMAYVIDSLDYDDNGYFDDNDDVASAIYTLRYLTYTVDMIWDYRDHGLPQGEYQILLRTKLDSLANPIYDYLLGAQQSDERGNSISLFLGVLGYAGLVLDAYNYINYVDAELHENLGNDFQLSGIYKEGLHYQSLAFIYLSEYFTARKRYENHQSLNYGEVNYYNRTDIKNMYENSIYLYCPDLSFTSFDDCFKVQSRNGYSEYSDGLDHDMRYPNGMFEYYYQQENASEEFKNFVDWYVWERLNPLNHGNYPTVHGNPLMLPIIISYNDEETISASETIPSKIQSPNYSNEEYTVLRDSISDSEEFRESLAVWVNHENSESYNIGHEQGDQTSFSLYYKGRNLTLS